MALILVIEDNPVNLELVTYLLRAHGHEVMAADDGSQGLALARSGRPDLVVCDLQMPGMDGHAVAAAMRADPQLKAMPLLAVTASAMVGDRDRALLAGFDAHLPKPIDPQRFVPWLESFLPPTAAPALPAAERASGGPPARALQAELCAPRPGLNLLMVDDRPVHQEFKRDLLEPAGYQVHTCGDVESAWALLQRTSVDLVVSDVVMPIVDGWEMLRRVRGTQTLGGLPFVFLTSTARDAASRRRAFASGADAYLVRPIEPERLLRELRGLLEDPGRG